MYNILLSRRHVHLLVPISCASVCHWLFSSGIASNMPWHMMRWKRFLSRGWLRLMEKSGLMLHILLVSWVRNLFVLSILTRLPLLHNHLYPLKGKVRFKANKMCFTESCTEFYAAYFTWLLLSHNFDMSIATIPTLYGYLWSTGAVVMVSVTDPQIKWCRPKAKARALAGIFVL